MKSDVWSTGLVLYELLTGQSYFKEAEVSLPKLELRITQVKVAAKRKRLEPSQSGIKISSSLELLDQLDDHLLFNHQTLVQRPLRKNQTHLQSNVPRYQPITAKASFFALKNLGKPQLSHPKISAAAVGLLNSDLQRYPPLQLIQISDNVLLHNALSVLHQNFHHRSHL